LDIICIGQFELRFGSVSTGKLTVVAALSLQREEKRGLPDRIRCG
jgi:hypothetical protein